MSQRISPAVVANAVPFCVFARVRQTVATRHSPPREVLAVRGARGEPTPRNLVAERYLYPAVRTAGGQPVCSDDKGQNECPARCKFVKYKCVHCSTLNGYSIMCPRLTRTLHYMWTRHYSLGKVLALLFVWYQPIRQVRDMEKMYVLGSKLGGQHLPNLSTPTKFVSMPGVRTCESAVLYDGKKKQQDAKRKMYFALRWVPHGPAIFESS